MTSQQYRRANKIVYIIEMILMAYMTAIILLVGLTMKMGATQLIQIIAGVLMMIMCSVGFFKFRESKMGCILIITAPTILYAVAMIFGRSDYTYVYAFPILFSTIVYLNQKLMIIGSVDIVIFHFIHIMIMTNMENSTVTADAILVSIMIVVIVIITANLATRLLLQFNNENMKAIEEKAAEQEAANATMLEVADNISKNFEKAQLRIEELRKSLDASNFAVKNIADSTESTAEAIQQQLVMCNDIQQNVSNANEQTASMIDASGKATETVRDGVGIVDDLKNQAEAVKEASKVTVASTEKLTERIKDVESFVDNIIGISSQTNLLALNASIEAARAGEAGKGFAVVADQIRQLSEQTQQASNKITEIIHELNNDAQMASGSVNNSVESVAKQNEMIEMTNSRFSEIDEEVAALTELIKENEASMKLIFKATEVIVENISQLSATTEEVAASSNEGYKTSEEAVSEMEECKKSLDEIYVYAKKLEEFTK